jgi:hypothetical protein
MSESFINQVTLDCLLNKQQYNKYLFNKTEKVSNRKDKKFYRKRIFSLTKELLLTKERPEFLFPDVEYAFDNYVNSCIQYFKTIDSNDIIQNEYSSFVGIATLSNITGLADDDADDEDFQSKEDADKLLMRSINISKSSLDNFVKTKLTKKAEEMVLPKQKDINLADPILKTKGVLKFDKKKNITNKYDEANDSKKIKEDKNKTTQNTQNPEQI